MKKATPAYARLQRGELYRPVSYWTAFLCGSMAAHVLALAVWSDAALFFLKGLRKPEPERYSLVYVGLVFGAPRAMGGSARMGMPAPPGAARVPQGPAAKKPGARPVPRRGPAFLKKAGGIFEKERPAGEWLPGGEAAKKPSLEKIKTASALVEAEPPPPEEEGIIVIRGTEKTMAVFPPPVAYEARAGDFNRREDADLKKAGPAPVEVSPEFAAGTFSVETSLSTLRAAEGPAVPASAERAEQPAAPAPETPVLRYEALRRADSGRKALLAPSLSGEEVPPRLSAMEKAYAAARELPRAAAFDAAPETKEPNILQTREAPPKTAVKITSPAPGPTGRGLVEIKGLASGRGVNSVFLSAGGRDREVLLKDGAFSVPVGLEEGRNLIRAYAVDASGEAARDEVVVVYAPAAPGASIAFDSPVDGSVIDAYKDKALRISGRAEGGAGRARLFLNGRVKDVEVVDGRFSETGPLDSEDNVLYAEAEDASGGTAKSAEIRFRVVFPKDILVSFKFSGPGVAPAVRTKWARHPLHDSQDAARPEFKVAGEAGGCTVSVGPAPPGIYTIALESEGGGDIPGASASVTLYGHDASRKKARKVLTGPKSGKYVPAVRVLVPECVFWEDDSWFSGIMEDGRSVTKFREPEGIIWREEE